VSTNTSISACAFTWNENEKGPALPLPAVWAFRAVAEIENVAIYQSFLLVFVHFIHSFATVLSLSKIK
jgi:hypothetical protein